MDNINKGFNLRDYFKEAVELEELLSRCKDKKELFKLYYLSEYYKNIKGEMEVFNKNSKIFEENEKLCIYDLNVNFRINLGIKNSRIEDILIGNYHKHNYYELIYVYKGEYSQEINGEIITLHQGEACILNPNINHNDIPIESGNTVLFFCFSNKFFYEIVSKYTTIHYKLDEFIKNDLKDQNSLEQYIIFRKNNYLICNEIVEEILKEYFSPHIGTKLILSGKIIRFLDILSNEYESLDLVRLNYLSTRTAFIDIDSFIEKNISDISRGKIANELHYNPNYINKIIRKNTGLTYSEYILNKKLKLAINLLKNSNLSINNIIKEVGYINKSYFYKVFTSKYSMTPQEFRVMFRNNL